MDPFVFAAVLFAAAFHASWNALIKIRLDPFLAIVLIAALAGIVVAAAAAVRAGAAARRMAVADRLGDHASRLLHRPRRAPIAPATWGRSIRSRAARRR